MLGSLFKAIYIFGMECQTTLLDPGEPVCRLPVEIYETGNGTIAQVLELSIKIIFVHIFYER